MNPEKLKKVEEIYHAVLDISDDKRQQFLKDSCGDDFEIRREVESLLSFETDFDSLIDSSPDSLIEEFFVEKSNLIGKQISHYKLLSKLGEGGMGTVYLAQDIMLERKVALKLLSGKFANDASGLNRFFREAKSASALNHPNILTVHEIGELEGTHYIVTEFIKGRTLLKYLSEEKPSLQAVLELAVQIASALSAAHEAGIIHRDIKPDNIMVRPDGIVKVLDFGIAKLTEQRQSSIETEQSGNENATLVSVSQGRLVRESIQTVPGMIIGTPQYMSPEQARGQNVDLRTDIFSFGVVLYEMIAGSPPFSGATNIDTIGSILKDEPKPLSELQPEISKSLETIVDKALRKDVEQRYRHIKDLFVDLNNAKNAIGSEAKLVQNTELAKAAKTVHTTSSIATERRFSLLHALVFLLIAGVAIGGIWWFLPASTNTGSIESQLKTTEVVSWSSSPGEVYSVGSFSPDGKMIAFTSTKSGTRNIWIKQTNAGEAIQITKDEFRNENPIWSPNGEELAFYSTKGDKAGFWRMPILGGSPKLISTVADGSSVMRYWSKTDVIYYESNHDIFAIEASTGQTKKITDFAAKSIIAESVGISNDEQKLAYITVEGETWNLWTKKLTDETPKKLFTSPTEIKNTAWHSDNNRIFFSAVVNDTFQVFVTDTSGTIPKQITSAERDSFVLNADSGGTRILYGSAKEESDIWGFNIKEDKEFTVASDINSELWANVSPDGKSIAYQSIKNLSQGNNLFNGKILTKKLNSEEQSGEVADNGFLPVWSPDGQSLAYMREVGGKHRIETIKVAGGGQKLLAADNVVPTDYTLLPYNRIQTSYFSWSPDSSKITYISDKNGLRNLWVVNADGTNDVQLTNNQDTKLYLNCPLWSPNGKQIAYTTRTANADTTGKDKKDVWLIDFETKISKQMTQSQGFLRLLGWKQTGNEVFLATTSGSSTVGLQPEVSLKKLDIAKAETVQIATLKDTYLYNIHLSPDAKQIAFAAHREGKDNLWLMASTGGEAKKMTTNNDSRLYFSSLAWSPDNNSIFFGKQSRYSLLSMLSNFK